jgi:Trk K+ transport system NAD-binding subunit
VLIHRDGKYLTPTGETRLEARDHLLIMSDKKAAEWVRSAFHH